VRGEIPGFRRSYQRLLRGAGRKVRLGVIRLQAVVIKPGSKEHLHRTAAKPVALLVIGPNAANAGSKALRNDGGQRFVSARGYIQLPLGRGRAADEANL